jgi:RNA polymerase sigma-70 factor (ECF subfamily)
MSNNMGGKNHVVSDEDYQLVSLCQGGDPDAFQPLVEKYQRKLLNMAYRIIGDYEVACESVQDAFLSAFKSIGKFRGEAKFSTWLYRIVINVSRNHLRQMRGRLRREGFSIDDCDHDKKGLFDDPPAQGFSVLEELERKEVQLKVRNCINALDAEYREVLVLRDLQELSYEEIRDILRIPDGTVKSRLFRARDALKDCLKKTLGDA